MDILLPCTYRVAKRRYVRTHEAEILGSYVCMYVCRYISTYEDEILEEYECGANRCVPYCDNDFSALYTYIKAYGDYRICVGKVMPPICVYIKEVKILNCVTI